MEISSIFVVWERLYVVMNNMNALTSILDVPFEIFIYPGGGMVQKAV